MPFNRKNIGHRKDCRALSDVTRIGAAALAPVESVAVPNLNLAGAEVLHPPLILSAVPPPILYRI
jgi:hypothetical protein